ncbi:MAG: hypothetical protein N4A49_04795 [Marinifilaceae bacterium]|jgi:hypothetical protein|nr:hypothetical protein [Marinifilaceae bacterium]
MKKILKNLGLILCLVSILCSCSDDDEVEKIELKAEILSFGFYAEDNADVLHKDYIVENITDNIIINMSDEISKAALKARFTITDGATVELNGTVQVSKETANNYEAPVDFIVKNGDTNKKYTVKIVKSVLGEWSNLPDFTYPVYSVNITTDPKTGTPYLGYEKSSDDGYLAAMVKLNGTSWDQVGKDGFSAARARYSNFNISDEGIPYVAYLDYEEDPNTGSSAYKTTAMKYESGSWSVVGQKAFSGVKTSNINMVFSGNTPVVASINAATDGAYIKRALNIKSFNSVWTNSPITGRADDLTSFAIDTKTINGITYLSSMDVSDPMDISVSKLENNVWTVLGDKLKDGESSVVYTRGAPKIGADQNGNVVVVIAQDTDGNKEYILKVKKYNAAKQQWSKIGADIVDASSRYYDLSVSPNGEIMLVYLNDIKTPMYMYFDTELNVWSEAVELESVEASNIKIVSNKNNEFFVIYEANDITKVKKFTPAV